MAANYALFSEFCREVGSHRGLFTDEAQLVTKLMEIYGIGKQARILDAACGTGDVVGQLWKHGFRNLHASDGSTEMLSKWDPEFNEVPRSECDWVRLDELFASVGTFDVIYFLGHSLPHASADEIRRIFGLVHRGMRSDGLLAFDLRDWARTIDGKLLQGGRKPDEWRKLQEVNIRDCSYQLMDKVTYDKGMQSVSYRLIPQSPGAGEIFTMLNYHVFDSSQAKEWLVSAGFGEDKIEVPKIESPHWPYLVVTCRQ